MVQTMSRNKLSQSKDIQGSQTHDPSMIKSDEPLKLGRPLAGQTGSSASLSGTAPLITVSGLTGMTANSECKFLTIEGADGYNSGTFRITTFVNSSTVIISNPSFVGPESNNGSISWIERYSYSAEDDHNFHRTDREYIKGVNYYDPIPQYYRCTDQITPIDANLSNISGNTTDAKSFVDNIRFYNISVSPGNTFITLNSVGNLKHADSVDITGVPINDGYDSGNYEATFVAILDDGYSTELSVLAGSDAGNRIYGRTRAGSSVSPDSVEIEFRSVPTDSDYDNSVSYTWESGQSAEISVIIGFRTCLNNLSEIAFRKLLLNGVLFGSSSQSSGGGQLPVPNGVGQVLFAIASNTFNVAMPVTSTQGWLVNDDGILLVNEVYPEE